MQFRFNDTMTLFKHWLLLLINIWDNYVMPVGQSNDFVTFEINDHQPASLLPLDAFFSDAVCFTNYILPC